MRGSGQWWLVWGGLALVAAPPGALSAQRPGVDVFLYHFELRLPDTGSTITATATIAYRRSSASGDTLALDLTGMQVDSVLNSSAPDSTARRFTYDGHQIRIPLGSVPATPTSSAPRPSLLGRVTIAYHGAPTDGLLIGADARGHRGAFADNWPERARDWLPTVDMPGDKSAVDFVVNAPAGWQVVANGRLLDTVAVDDGRMQWTWRERRPIPTYTMVVAAGPLVQSIHRAAGGLDGETPISVWTWPQDSAFADSVPFKSITEIVEAFTRIVGPFPYEKLAHVESATKYGGMENASAIFYAEQPYVDRTMGESVVRHETAHQWFGDAVTERDFHHLWLSEGFATYFDLVVGTALHGDSVMRLGMQAHAASYLKSPVVDRPIIDTAEHDPTKLLNANNYQKGAWVLHMLRAQVGDSAFFRGIRDYYATYRDSSVLTPALQAMLERSSRKNLTWFFHQWLWQAGYPQLQVVWHYEPFKHQAVAVIQQGQPPAWGYFRLPDLAVEFTGPDGKTVRRRFDVDGASTSTRIDLPWVPTAMRVDPDGAWLLTASVQEEKR